MSDDAEHERRIEIPPALWWTQSQAARLEAERLSPLDLADVSIKVRRQGFWRPGKVAVFEARYRRSHKADNPPALGRQAHTIVAITPRDWLYVAGATLILAVAVMGSVSGASLRAGQSQFVMREETQPSAPSRFEPVQTMVQDLATVFSAAPTSARLSAVRWSPSKVTLTMAGGDEEVLRATVREKAPHLRIELQSIAPSAAGSHLD